MIASQPLFSPHSVSGDAWRLPPISPGPTPAPQMGSPWFRETCSQTDGMVCLPRDDSRKSSVLAQKLDSESIDAENSRIPGSRVWSRMQAGLHPGLSDSCEGGGCLEQTSVQLTDCHLQGDEHAWCQVKIRAPLPPSRASCFQKNYVVKLRSMLCWFRHAHFVFIFEKHSGGFLQPPRAFLGPVLCQPCSMILASAGP